MPITPDNTDWRNWALYSVSLFGLIEQAESYRLATAECLDAHRNAGDIR